MHDALGDRVGVWTTLNEPWCSSFLSYTGGEHAPGRQDVAAGLAAGHHLLLAHGLAVQALRERDPGLELGITLNLTVAKPVDPTSPGDLDAARRIDGQFNRFFLDPIFHGAYPDDLLADVGHLGLDAVVQRGDLEVISTPIDALGVNYYHGESVSDRPAERSARWRTRRPTDPRDRRSRRPTGSSTTRRDCRSRRWTGRCSPTDCASCSCACTRSTRHPPGVAPLRHRERRGLRRRRRERRPRARPGSHGVPRRSHLGAILDAIDEGVPVHGYFYWSLMDNFEWAWGYDKRFGLVRVDYDTQERTVKDSGLAYASIIRGRATSRALNAAAARRSRPARK